MPSKFKAQKIIPYNCKYCIVENKINLLKN